MSLPMKFAQCPQCHLYGYYRVLRALHRGGPRVCVWRCRMCRHQELDGKHLAHMHGGPGDYME